MAFKVSDAESVLSIGVIICGEFSPDLDSGGIITVAVGLQSSIGLTRGPRSLSCQSAGHKYCNERGAYYRRMLARALDHFSVHSAVTVSSMSNWSRRIQPATESSARSRVHSPCRLIIDIF